MLFKITSISATTELVYANDNSLINIYPSYHQIGDLFYQTVATTDWETISSGFQFDVRAYTATADTIPMIQLVYYPNATEEEKAAQLAAFRQLTEIETVANHIFLRAHTRPAVDFRIRYRVLNKVDLAIALDKNFAIGAGFDNNEESANMVLVSYNPVTKDTTNFFSIMPVSSNRQIGMAAAGLEQRLQKLEYLTAENALLAGKNFRIIGYDSIAATNAITVYYTTYTDVAAVGANTWYQVCSMLSRPGDTGFTIASRLFYQQAATVLDITTLYTRYVTDFSYAFADNPNLTEIIGLDLLDTRNAVDLSYMFSDNAALTKIDLSQIITSRVSDISGLFKGCISLQEIDVTSFDFIDLIQQSDIFTGVPNNCLIWVSDAVQYDLIHDAYPNLTNITYR